MAAQNSFRFGQNIVFTYGPLGFLSVPTFYFGWTGILSLMFTSAVAISFTFTVIRLGRKTLGWPLSFLVAYACLFLAPFDAAEVVLVIVAMWCLAWITGSEDPASSSLLAVVGGAVAAFQLLMKFDSGAEILLVIGLTLGVVSSRRLRDEILLALSFAGGLVILWLAINQSPHELLAFLRRSMEIASGYSSAMSREESRSVVQYGLLALLLIPFFLLFTKRRKDAQGHAVLAWIVLVAMVYVEFLHGFIRHDWQHSQLFFLFIALALLGVVWSSTSRRLVAGLCIGSLLIAGVLNIPHVDVLDEITSRPGRALGQWGLIFDSSRRNQLVARARESMQASLELDPASLALLAGHQVSIDPAESYVAWAYGLSWRPVPVFQTYSAYTLDLDHLNVEGLLSREGPDRVLRSGPLRTIDFRYPLFDSPDYEFTLLCDFRQLRATPRWQVLARISDRCGAVRSLGQRTVIAGGSVSIPRPKPGEIIVASIETKPSVLSLASSLVFKTVPEPRIYLDAVGYRFVTATAHGPLLLCIPANAEAAEYGGGVCPSSLRLERAGSYRIQFFSIPLSS